MVGPSCRDGLLWFALGTEPEHSRQGRPPSSFPAERTYRGLQLGPHRPRGREAGQGPLPPASPPPCRRIARRRPVRARSWHCPRCPGRPAPPGGRTGPCTPRPARSPAGRRPDVRRPRPAPRATGLWEEDRQISRQASSKDPPRGSDAEHEWRRIAIRDPCRPKRGSREPQSFGPAPPHEPATPRRGRRQVLYRRRLEMLKASSQIHFDLGPEDPWQSAKTIQPIVVSGRAQGGAHQGQVGCPKQGELQEPLSRRSGRGNSGPQRRRHDPGL